MLEWKCRYLSTTMEAEGIPRNSICHICPPHLADKGLIFDVNSAKEGLSSGILTPKLRSKEKINYTVHSFQQQNPGKTTEHFPPVPQSISSHPIDSLLATSFCCLQLKNLNWKKLVCRVVPIFSKTRRRKNLREHFKELTEGVGGIWVLGGRWTRDYSDQ